MIDKSILLALQKGSHPAFEKVFVFYYTKIRSFIFGYIKSMTDAEDLTEEIFVELWQNHQNIKPEKSFDSYLYTIAKNKAINFLKRKYTSEKINEINAFTTFSHSPEEEYIALEKALLIEMIVEKMPAQRKKIYQLRQKGLTNEEIAKELETTKRNVESQVSFALKEIRKGIQYLIICYQVFLFC